MTDPFSEFGLLLNFLGVDETKLQFEYNTEKGFYCLREPVPQCLSEAKGRTRSNKYADPTIKYANQFETFKQFYKPEMVQFSKLLEKTGISDRFSWLQDYIAKL